MDSPTSDQDCRDEECPISVPHTHFAHVEHEPASERVRDAWDSLPGDSEVAIDYPSTTQHYIDGDTQAAQLDPHWESGVASDDSDYNYVQVSVSLANGRRLDFGDTFVSDPGDTVKVVEALDRVNSSIMAWLDMHRHQLEAH